jgi:hypothetical protein
MTEEITIRHTDFITHNVLHFITEKPEGYNFKPGQATEVSIGREEWKDEKRPFTFTSLPQEDHLEFTIKVYPSLEGVTKELPGLVKGDTLFVHDIFGAINYKGPGVFIAGGAGVTPFIAILKDLADKGELQGNKLLFANKTSRDIILQEQFEEWLGDDFINILSNEKTEEYAYGHIDKEFLNEHVDDFSRNFYLCGPPEFIEDVEKDLRELGMPAGKLVKEDL